MRLMLVPQNSVRIFTQKQVRIKKLIQMSKFKYVNYGDEKFVYNTETGQVLSHWVHLDQPRKKRLTLTRVLSNIVRIFTA